MKKLFLIMSLVIIFTHPRLAVAGETQLQIYTNSCESYKKADKELNSAYQQIFTDKNYSKKTAFISALKSAQIGWLSFEMHHLKLSILVMMSKPNMVKCSRCAPALFALN